MPVISLVLVTLCLSILITIINPAHIDISLSSHNLRLIAMQAVIIGIGGLGMTMVIISGGIDLSAGSMVALSSVTLASVMHATSSGSPGDDSWSISLGALALALFAAIALCSFCGLINGSLSTRFRIAPFIVTLAMMQIARGCAKWMSGNEMVRTPPNLLQNVMDPLPSAPWLFFSPGVWILLLLTLFISYLLSHTLFGRYVYAAGSGEKNAQQCGIPIHKLRMVIYTLCGTLSGIAGIMQYCSLGSGSASDSVGLELDIIAAVVIGGGSLEGGEGSAFGTLAGALIMSTLRSGFVMLGLPGYFQEIVIGIVLVAAVGFDRLKNKAA